jgi:RHS repeat-associated protein
VACVEKHGHAALAAHEKNGATQAAFGYTYNSVGNRTSKVVNMQSVVRTETTTYDAIDQVTGVNYGNSRSESFLYDAMGNRVYSAELGRFHQSDPIRFDAGDGNLYRYVGNSVSDKIDPFGLDECCHPKQLKPDPEHIRQCNEAAIACNAAVAVAYASCMRVCTAVPHPLGRASCVIGCQLILAGHAYCEATRQVCIKNAPKVCI